MWFRCASSPTSDCVMWSPAIPAATLAAAMKCPLEVFVPEWASAAVVDTLQSLGAKVIRCPREPGELGDPCVRLANAAVASGALPFSCQGTANGLTIDGGRTLGWELAEQVPALGSTFVQVGGGALATAVATGLAEGGSAAELFAVQAEGCAPLDRAVQRVAEHGLGWAIHHRGSVMWPWESEPHSATTGFSTMRPTTGLVCVNHWSGLVDNPSLPRRSRWSRLSRS